MLCPSHVGSASLTKTNTMRHMCNASSDCCTHLGLLKSLTTPNNSAKRHLGHLGNASSDCCTHLGHTELIDEADPQQVKCS